MKLSELRKTAVIRSMPMGKHEITFDHIEYREDANGDINGIWIHNKEYRPLFVPFFNETNYQLDLLTEQLGVDSYDTDEINKATGTVIIARKYTRTNDKNPDEPYTNVSFNPRYNEKQNEAIDNLA